MTTPIPISTARTKPKAAMHDLDSLIWLLEEARPLYHAIHEHCRNSKQPSDGYVAWLDVTDSRLIDIITLENAGLIARIRVNGRWLARTVPEAAR